MSLIDSINSHLTASLINEVALKLEESQTAVNKALTALTPIVLDGIVAKSENPELITAILSADSKNILSHLMNANTEDSAITSFLCCIFGEKANIIIAGISKYSNIKESSSSTLFDVVTGITVCMIKEYTGNSKLTVREIPSFLKNQRNLISDLYPSDLSAHLLPTFITTSRSTPAPSTRETKKDFMKWVLPTLLLAIVICLTFKKCQENSLKSTLTTSSFTNKP